MNERATSVHRRHHLLRRRYRTVVARIAGWLSGVDELQHSESWPHVDDEVSHRTPKISGPRPLTKPQPTDAIAGPLQRVVLTPKENRMSFSDTNHDAAPAATARTDSATGEPGGGHGSGGTDKPVTRPVPGTGDTT
jgi:hypothetical protein